MKSANKNLRKVKKCEGGDTNYEIEKETGIFFHFPLI